MLMFDKVTQRHRGMIYLCVPRVHGGAKSISRQVFVTPASTVDRFSELLPWHAQQYGNLAVYRFIIKVIVAP